MQASDVSWAPPNPTIASSLQLSHDFGFEPFIVHIVAF